LEWAKGVDVLIDAIDYIVHTLHIEHLFLDMVGYGYDAKKYQEQSHALGLDTYILFHGPKQ
jgi:hypothetical protein